MWVPEACTLPTAERPLRVAEFDALFADALERVERPEPGRLRMSLHGGDGGDGGGVGERARDLAERESACCSFFTFTFSQDDPGRVLMEVAVPPEHTAVLDALAERATGAAPRAAS